MFEDMLQITLILGKLQLKKLKNSLLDLLFPPICRVCNHLLTDYEDGGLCLVCLKDVPPVNSPMCSVCGRDFKISGEIDHICEKCLRQKPPYIIARAVTFYAEPVSSLLHRLKYKFDTTVAPPLLKIAQGFDFSPFESCDVVIPVPLYYKRLKVRGLNHALILARLFFPDKKDLIYSNILVRTRDTVSQTTLNGIARRKNLQSAFCVENKSVIRGMSICLVDDVYTTGTTVIECSRVLMEAGAAEVKVLTMARVKEVR